MACDSTLQWISHLRDEVRNAAEAGAAERAARHGFWAALLCRRTFAIFVDSDSNINSEDLCSFIQASMALQENLVVDLAELPSNLRNMLVRDMKMAYRIRRLIQHSIESNPESLGAAINKNWSDADNSSGRTYSPWQFLSSPDKRWVMSVITSTTSKFNVSQVVHYNFVEGHLMVNGKPLGRLPLDIRESGDVKELFGNQHLLTFPSLLSGMSYVMATRIHGNEVHFGLRGKSVVIQAFTRDSLLEYVPRHVFMDNDKFDLPLGLIENCVHWLNLHTSRLEIRRKPYIWRTRSRDWILDFINRRAQRSRVLLVDPYSDLCKRVASIFCHFQDPQRLTVFQPAQGRLSVEMRQLELSFFVNKSSLLECRELNTEIDPNQDAGTLYGFQSKIVLRDVCNNERRSIITPLGQLTYQRHGMHVAVQSSSTTAYGRFGIDDVLGRLSCPPESRLLYSKAQFHAFTSFVLPDPLTGRTGVEEALHILKSGYCQPWTPFVDSIASILRAIGKLSPARDYYPKDKRRLQTVTWNQHLVMSIQHDSYEGLIQEILTKSERLQAFNTNEDKGINLSIDIPSHLQRRGELRRRLYERSISDLGRLVIEKDKVYKPRDRLVNLPQATNVYQIVRVFRKQPFRIQINKELAAILGEWKLIGGFQHTHTDAEDIAGCLSDLIENSIGEQWGSLLDLCRRTDPQDPYRLIFRLCLLSFSTRPDMNAIWSLVAFGGLDELKVLHPPMGPCFVDFQLRAFPTLELLLKVIAADYPAVKLYGRKSRTEPSQYEESHRVLREAEGRRLASFILEQWPNPEPSAEKFESTVLDGNLAVERILPEWQRLHRNMGLSEYVIRAQEILDRYKGTTEIMVPRVWNKEPVAFCMPSRGSIVPSLSDLLAKCTPLPWGRLPYGVLPSENVHPGIYQPSEQNNISQKTTPSKEIIELGKILNLFATSPDLLRQQYGNDLKKSLLALENVRNRPQFQESLPGIDAVKDNIVKARAALNRGFQHIKNALSAEDDCFQWLQLASLWPCITPITMLEQLRSSYNHKFGKNMREILVAYGVLATNLQRLLRIRHIQAKGDHQKLVQEWQNAGHENWSPLEFTDWLLLEIESDLLIRNEQIDVAHAIISPTTGLNSVLQMNMGKGKQIIFWP
jgi:hypothetical protein